MKKVFEDYFSELQADMVSICLEYVDDVADHIFIYGSCESGVISSDFFYCINGHILERNRINEGGLIQYDDSADRQRMVLQILREDIIKIKDVCKEYNREMPTEFKIVYNVKKNSLNANYRYDPMYSNDEFKTADDVADEWFKEIKSKYNKNLSEE